MKLFGKMFRKEHMFKMKEIEEEVKQAIRRQKESICQKKLRFEDQRQSRFENLILYNLNEGGAVITDNNDVKIFTDGREKYSALIYEMEQARRYIHLQYYIIKNDEIWQKISEVLIRKASQGVEVRILFDSIGCREMQTSEWQNMKTAGVQVEEFFPALFGKFQLRINYRNHRKIAVIDGRVGFLGGFNIGREYVGIDKKFGYWRDTHIRIEGGAVTSLAVRFVLDWNYAAKENLFTQDYLFEIPEYQRSGKEPIQIISSGPDSKSKVIRNNYLKLIQMANKNVYIQTPYFIPDEGILEALKKAIRAGVDVRIMIPCKPDHPFVYWATYSYMGDMIEAGAKCYIYTNGFLHAKCMCVDGLVTCVGTANMDIRSFDLNFEVNATIYSADITNCLEKIFEQDICVSSLVTKTKYRDRSKIIKVKEQICRLLSPFL